MIAWTYGVKSPTVAGGAGIGAWEYTVLLPTLVAVFSTTARLPAAAAVSSAICAIASPLGSFFSILAAMIGSDDVPSFGSDCTTHPVMPKPHLLPQNDGEIPHPKKGICWSAR